MSILQEDDYFSISGIILPSERRPVGHYYAYVCPFNTKTTRTKKGEKCIRWEFEILGPMHQGVIVHKWSLLEGPGVAYTKGDFRALGMTVQSLHDCRVAMRMLRNSVLNIHIYNNERNFYCVDFLSKAKQDEIDMGPVEYKRNMYFSR